MNNKPDFEFKQGGFFHQMFGSYGAAVTGLTFFDPSFFQPVLEIRQNQNQDLCSKFYSKDLGKNILLKPITTFAHLQNSVISEQTIRQNLLFMLINICYEHVKDELKFDNPVHEFFRHLRNAASHNGKFYFKNGQPRNKAEWRGKVITIGLQDLPIWSADIDEGDVFLLLYDIEQDLIQSLNVSLNPTIDLL